MAPVTAKKTRATKAAEKAKPGEATVQAADTTIVTNTPEGASGTAREAPSAGSGGDALQASSGTQSAPPSSIPAAPQPVQSTGGKAEPEAEPVGDIDGEVAQATGSEATSLPDEVARPRRAVSETGEASEGGSAAAAPDADLGIVYEPADNPPEQLARGILKVNVNEHIFEGWLVVIGPPEGRRRAGRRFGPTPTAVRAEDLTSEQLAGLYADPLLTIRAT
ncbi:Uncharacterised protein [Starkeya nomas]|uniref:Mu-like prophage FluMu N-terminal domain-containing protein n=1 Tax=Starkeya nomas TaxID=2666134 RepID=A0A5S9R679_9HYPH|nr:hypothetical protein [Starkeya nomas]CAA0129464.1 Uncharacterised protein [Starkeya nomas]